MPKYNGDSVAISLRLLSKVAFPNINMDDPSRSIFILCNYVTFFSRTKQNIPVRLHNLYKHKLTSFLQISAFIQYVLYVLDDREEEEGACQQCSFKKIIINIFLLYFEVYKQPFL